AQAGLSATNRTRRGLTMATIQNLANKALALNSVAQISQYIINKQPPKVIHQTPDPGTPVIQGMTIEIQAVSFSDVPYSVIDQQAPVAVKNVSMADMETVIENNPTLKSSVQNGVISPNDTDAVLQALNTGLAQKGLSGQLSSSDAAELVKSINDAG